MLRILVVCTGNTCRSPMAEVLLARHLEGAGLSAMVESVGTIEGGKPASANGVRAMKARGLDTSAHVSRQMTAADVEAAHLVLAMAGEHLVTVTALVEDAFDKTFTIKDFVQRGSAEVPSAQAGDLQSWLTELGAGRLRSDLLRLDPSADVADPIGRGRRVFDRTASELDALTEHVSNLLRAHAPGP